MVGKLDEVEFSQIENHMGIVHGVMLQLVEIARTAEQMVLVIDLKKIKPKLFSNKMIVTALKKIFAFSVEYFPNFLYKGFIVNAPMSFSTLWNSLESSLSTSTREKIKVIGGCSNPEIDALVHLR